MPVTRYRAAPASPIVAAELIASSLEQEANISLNADMSSAAAISELTEAVNVARQAKLFRGLGDPSRLSILEALRGGPLTVGEIVAATVLTQPNASNHLRCLSECGLVSREQRGRFVHYRLTDPRIDALLAIAGQLLDGAAQAVDVCENYGTGD